MFVSRPGSLSTYRNLDLLLRASYDDHRAARSAEIARRTKDRIPLDGLEPLPEYDAEPDLASIHVRLRHLSAEEFRDLMNGIHASPDDTPEGKRLHAQSQIREIRQLVARVVGEVKGLTTHNDDGEEVELVLVAGDRTMPEEQLDLLHENGLLFVLFSVARDFQRLTSAEKKVCGLPRP